MTNLRLPLPAGPKPVMGYGGGRSRSGKNGAMIGAGAEGKSAPKWLTTAKKGS